MTVTLRSLQRVLRPPYGVIVADPPWKFSTWSARNQDVGKGAVAQYALMSLDDIKALPIADLAADRCFLFLWTTGWAMATGQAHAVARAWGFEPKSETVWLKRTKTGKFRVGTGYIARSMHEPILIATRGKTGRLGVPSAFDGLAREHSRKPDEFYALLKGRTRGLRRCDLFARETHDGFDGWGAERHKFDRLGPSERRRLRINGREAAPGPLFEAVP